MLKGNFHDLPLTWQGLTDVNVFKQPEKIIQKSRTKALNKTDFS